MSWLGRAAAARGRFWIEGASACLSASLALATLIRDDWIERVFGFHPDSGSGALELGLVALSFCVSLMLVVLARREWRRVTPAEVVR